MRVTGVKQLRARLKALKVSFKPIGRKWGRAAINAGRPMVPYRTGRLRKSMRILSATQKKARVGAWYTAYFIDSGVKAHAIRPKRARGLVFEGRRGTVFARSVNHRGFRARPFRQRMAEEGLRQTPLAQEIIDAWNSAG